MASYPTRYVWHCTMKDGSPVTVRPIRPEDEPLMVEFHRTLSDRTVYLRYFHSLSLDRRVAHDRLADICDCDYDREMVLVAVTAMGQPGGREHIVAVARLNKLKGDEDAEVAALVSDDYQRKGLGSMLMERIVEIGREWGLRRLVAELLRDNLAMQTVMKRLGFQLRFFNDPDSLEAVLVL